MKLARRVGDKTRREHMEAYWKATGRKPKPLQDAGECPDGFGPVWRTFCRLSQARGVGMANEPISYADIAAFQGVAGVRLRPWQVELIERLDGLWLGMRAEWQKKAH
jgi:hypothetical protein